MRRPSTRPSGWLHEPFLCREASSWKPRLATRAEFPSRSRMARVVIISPRNHFVTRQRAYFLRNAPLW
jgi:hypothetical protein